METSQPNLHKKGMNKIKLLIIGVVIIIGIFLYPHLVEIANLDNLRGFVYQFGVFAPVAFSVVYVVAGLLFVPLSLFSIAGGVLFGTVKGTIVIVVAATTAAMLSFILARPFHSLIPRSEAGIIHKLQHRIEKQLDHNTFQTILILRLLFPPYIIFSYACGLVRTCKFWPYSSATFFSNIVGSFVFVYLGASLDKGLQALLLPAVLVALVIFIPKVVRKFTKLRINQEIKK